MTNASGSTKSRGGKTSGGFTAEERAAMKERAQELKAEAGRGKRKGKADGEADVLAKIAEMPDADRIRVSLGVGLNFPFGLITN